MKTKYIIIALILATGLSACVVSKKKYEALSWAKRASDRKVRTLLKNKRELEQSLENKSNTIFSLQDKLRGLKEEFNNLKYDMSASNAQKSSEIDKLSKKLGNTLKNTESIKEKSQELEGDLEWLRKERQKNIAQIDSLQVSLVATKRELQTLQTEKETLGTAKEKADKKITDLTSKVNALEELLKRQKATNLKLQNQLKATPKKVVKKVQKATKVQKSN